jgi:hypothetical protein
MSKQMRGTIEAVSLKKNYGTYGIKIDGEWYNTTKEPSSLNKGDKVRLKFEKVKGRNRIQGLKVLEKGAPQSKGGSGGGRSGGGYQNVDWNAAVARAIEASSVIIEHGGLKLLKSKPDANEEAIVALIDRLTVKFFSDVQTKKPAKVEKEIEDDLDDDDEDLEDEDLEEEFEDDDADEEGDDDDVEWDD